MYTANNLIRVNVTLPEKTVRSIKKIVPPRAMSKFLAEAAEERLNKMKSKKALENLLKLPPTFKDIKNPSKHISEMRRLDEKRLKRLGL